MTNLRLLIRFSIIFFTFFSSYIILANTSDTIIPNSIAHSKIYIAHTTVGIGVDTTLLKPTKIYAAINLICMLTDKYALISDSIISHATEKIPQPCTAFDVAKSVEADIILIIKVEQLHNIIRTEIISVDPKRPDTAKTGEGFALLHLFKKKSDEPIYDPALLTALQRAFAVVENDSLMFQNQIDPFNVTPVPNLVIAGIEFHNNPQYNNWEVFANPLITSFEYTEVIFEVIHNSKKYLVFDTESRDAIYGMFNLALIENNIAPSNNELDALKRFGVSYYITGKLVRTKYGVEITLSLNQLSQYGNIQIKSVSDTVNKNKILDVKNTIKNLAEKLIEEK